MKALIVFNIILFLAAGCGQNAENNEVSEKIQQAFSNKYADVKDVKWERDDNGYYEAQFKYNGEKFRADFTKDGKWIETENSVKYEQLPQPVKTLIEDEYEKEEITEIEFVDNSTKGKFYDVEFKRKGKNSDLMITTEGKIIGND